jgi:hypothetical protein
MQTLMEGASDEIVTPLLVTSMAVNREGGGTRPPAARKRPPGAVEDAILRLIITCRLQI